MLFTTACMSNLTSDLGSDLGSAASPMLTLRAATTVDLLTLLTFEENVISEERPFDATLKDAPIHYYDLPALIASPEAELVVAELDGRIVGCGYARIDEAEQFKSFTHFAYLGFMYVVPEHRGRGINARVIRHLRDWAAFKGITELFLEVYSENEKAIRAYEKVGFKRYMSWMRMEA
jgi:ribosomal protein S18 acetylase RimI-like enzyme